MRNPDDIVKASTLRSFADHVQACAAGWDAAGVPYPPATYVTNVMARQYANWLLGLDPDGEWPEESRGHVRPRPAVTT